jgi:hypothetical protein
LALISFLLAFVSLPGHSSVLDHDSLLYIIEENEDDSLRIRALIDFATDIRDEYPDSAFIYLQNAEDIAENINNTYLLSVIHTEEGAY